MDEHVFFGKVLFDDAWMLDAEAGLGYGPHTQLSMLAFLWGIFHRFQGPIAGFSRVGTITFL